MAITTNATETVNASAPITSADIDKHDAEALATVQKSSRPVLDSIRNNLTSKALRIFNGDHKTYDQLDFFEDYQRGLSTCMLEGMSHKQAVNYLHGDMVRAGMYMSDAHFKAGLRAVRFVHAVNGVTTIGDMEDVGHAFTARHSWTTLKRLSVCLDTTQKADPVLHADWAEFGRKMLANNVVGDALDAAIKDHDDEIKRLAKERELSAMSKTQRHQHDIAQQNIARDKADAEVRKAIDKLQAVAKEHNLSPDDVRRKAESRNVIPASTFPTLGLGDVAGFVAQIIAHCESPDVATMIAERLFDAIETANATVVEVSKVA